MNDVILSIHDLSVNYGGIEAVKGISFDVHEGEIVTLIGANGAGKSSTLRTIAGLVKPSGGTINFRGDNITGRDATTIVKKGITLVPEGRHIFPDLTVLENLKVGAYLRSDDISGDIQWVYDLSRACASARGRRAARFPAASSRCLLWAARSWHARSSL